MKYKTFIESKRVADPATGLGKVPHLNDKLFDFQRDIVTWALRRGRAAIFADCGMGKTIMQLEWANHIPGNVLIVAPLAVSQQTIREGAKFGISITHSQDGAAHDGITITNYERLHHFSPGDFDGVVLDESSILKSYTGKFRNQLVNDWGKLKYKLACTATPAPNDYMELGNHAEFLGVMGRMEMLSMFFIHDGGETQKWRLKGHAEHEYWKWLCSWAVMIKRPSDMGYDDGDFILPDLKYNSITIDTNATAGFLFQMEAKTLLERNRARKDTTEARCKAAADMINATDDPWVIWCNLNDESALLKSMINDAIEVKGSDTPAHKENALIGFSSGDHKRIITKPSIAGFGMNWQHCHNVAFVGLSDSYEQFYQAIRRCWRFGQSKPVRCNIITADIEGAVLKNIQRKERDAESMAENMVLHMKDITSDLIHGAKRSQDEYKAKRKVKLPSFV
jgi:hypothetical protein